MEVGTGLFQADLAKMVEVNQMKIGNWGEGNELSEA